MDFVQPTLTTWFEIQTKDHDMTARVLAAAARAFAEPLPPTSGFVADLRDYLVGFVQGWHHQKEERAVFPRLAQRAAQAEGGLVAAMVTEHAQARELVSRFDAAAKAYIDGARDRIGELVETFRAYASFDERHRRKESDVLYPLANRLFSPEDAEDVLEEIAEMERDLGWGTRERYWNLAAEIVSRVELKDLSWGLKPEVLAAILNTLPIQLTFVDQDDRVRYFSHERGAQIVDRSRGVIGKEVQRCHPQKSFSLVEEILGDFKAGRRELVEFWFDMGPRKIHVRYWPVRDEGGKYLGCLETVQDVTAIQKLTGQNRLLDPVG
ncbi:PAS domain-containing protein [Anaeromyxobacter oryzae]|uniref:Hemerythrin-like domain-containing protein n=1 Tax=Anaeromyxobacter oryzae TaxID=2918170 RepID=A0ABN6N187_9BACT|nr:PAS domain-containing protein [Anaeromyxobacter oryzae]BDG05715.1 hypothetical protein AMOR_47110 [Anaeromyxobacter oryzae]